MKHTHRMLSLVLLLLTVLASTVDAQRFSYLYDSAGNRVSRIYVVSIPRSAAKKVVPIDTTEVHLAEKLNMEVYPNPTKGALNIDVNGLKESSRLEFRLFNPNGQFQSQ